MCPMMPFQSGLEEINKKSNHLGGHGRCPLFWTGMLLQARMTLQPRANMWHGQRRRKERRQGGDRVGEDMGRKERGAQGDKVERLLFANRA